MEVIRQIESINAQNSSHFMTTGTPNYAVFAVVWLKWYQKYVFDVH